MNEEISNLSPKILWTNFAKICDIPRPSKKEAKMIEFVTNFAKNLGLEYEVDKAGNVVIRKPATPGMENRETVILQSHLDMVPQKEKTSQHNFETDPILPYIDGEWVTATETTLGSDNGMGVAAALSVLESKDIAHAPIEALFTVDEETGMTGAFAVQKEFLSGSIFLNLDSEDEGELYIGCAGTSDTDAEFTCELIATPLNSIAIQMTASGFKGGHSGVDIHLNRGNAIKALALLLNQLFDQHPELLLVSIDGGSPVHNAIPREATATIVVPSKIEQAVVNEIESIGASIKNIYKLPDPDATFSQEKIETPQSVMSALDTERVLRALHLCPHGVMRMDDAIENFVETSTNLAFIKTEGNKISLFTSQRSNDEFTQNDMRNIIKELFTLSGANAKFSGYYPGWKPNPDAPIVKIGKEVYQNLFGAEPKVMAIHAGLEFSVLARTFPNLQIISFGPTIRFPHSPREKVNIASVDKFWKYLIELLKHTP